MPVSSVTCNLASPLLLLSWHWSGPRAQVAEFEHDERPQVKPTLLLRIASVFSLLHCVLHTGGVFSSPKHDAEEIAVVESTKSHLFNVFGSMRSYWDFLFGYRLFLTIGLLVQAILFWQLATFAKTNPAWTRPILALFLFNCIGMAIVSGKYFFIGPAVAQLLIAACLALAFATAAAV